MARNFAQIAFLIYAVLLTRTAHGAFALLLSKKMGKRAVKRRRSGLYHAVTFDRLKEHLPVGLWYLNTVTVGLLAVCAVFHPVFGWFDALAVLGKILNSMMLLSVGLLATAGALLSGVLRYGEMFYLYKKNEDPNSMQPFSSSVLDGLMYIVLPVLMIICNFTAI